jgi:hypothetical protein
MVATDIKAALIINKKKIKKKGFIYYLSSWNIVHWNIFFVFFFYNLWFFFQSQLHSLILGVLEIEIYNFNLHFIRLSQSRYMNRKFNGLTQLTRVFFLFLIDLFFLVSSFNIELIENYTSWFVLVCFLWDYIDLMTWITNLAG